MPILSTKLFIPQITQKHIKREDLLRKLVRSYNLNSQLTLICAPAGYGKTTTVLELLSAVNSSSAWISLDEGDNDVSRFFSYIIAALKKAGIAIGDEIQYLASDVTFNSVNTILT